MVDLLLVNPLFLDRDPVEKRLMTPYFPLGLLYLAATAREAGYTVAIFDAMFQPDDQGFVAALEKEQPRVVGIAVLAAFITPTPDPINMGLIMLPLLVLYFFGILLAWIAQPKQAERAT